MLSDPVTLYKLMILYMLKNVKFPLSNSHLSEFFVGKEYTNYFTLQKAVNELLDAHLIKQETIGNSSRYEITREGAEALVFFGNSISERIQEDISTYLNENKLRLHNEVGIVADYYKSSLSDYIVQCEVREENNTLIQLTLSVPSKENAELICENWKDSNQAIYSYVMTELLRTRH